MILHYATDDAVRKVAGHRLQLVGSDGIFGAKPHPRLYGTAARFLGRFAIRDAAEFRAWIAARAGEFPETYKWIKRANLGLAEVDEELAAELEAGKSQCALAT